jgi:hypothetical protein
MDTERALSHQDALLPQFIFGSSVSQPRGNAAPNARRVIIQNSASVQVATAKLFKQPAAKAFLGWRFDKWATGLSPVQLQQSFVHTPLYIHPTFGP